nr:response regulator [Massilia sp. ST3]
MVEDDGFMLGVLADMLSGQDYRVLTAASGEEALGVLEREPVEVIVCDQDMPGMTGTALLAEVAHRYPASVRLMLTGQSDLAEIEAAMAAGVVDAHHAKPVAAGELRGHVEEALRLHRRRASSHGFQAGPPL